MRMKNKKTIVGPELRNFLEDADVSINLASKLALKPNGRPLAQSSMSRLTERSPENLPPASAHALQVLISEVEKNRCPHCRRYLPPKEKRKRA